MELATKFQIRVKRLEIIWS